jgi:hypothetical protein
MENFEGLPIHGQLEPLSEEDVAKFEQTVFGEVGKLSEADKFYLQMAHRCSELAQLYKSVGQTDVAENFEKREKFLYLELLDAGDD